MPRQKKTEPKQTTPEPEQTTPEPEPKTTEANPTLVKPLAGFELLQKVKELETFSKEDKARMCGYYSVNKNGLERINMMQFLNALIDADGIDLDGHSEGNGRGGRSASYRVAVQSNGNLLVGSAYTKQLGLNPGDEFEIALGRKHIHLKQIEAASEETAAPAIAD